MFTSELQSQVRRLQISARRAVSSLLGGEYHSTFRGSGLFFEDVREYQPGDDVRSIDWNVTARLGAPFVKRYVEERELTVLLAVDFSASLLGAKRTVAAELAALVAFAALQNNDRVGLLGFTDRVETYVPPAKGTRHALRLVSDILSFRPVHKGTDLGLALDHVNRVHRRRVIVFLLSDFLGPLAPPLRFGEGAGGWGGIFKHPTRFAARTTLPEAERVENQNAHTPLRGGGRGVGSLENTFRRTAKLHELIAVRITDGLEQSFPAVGLVQLEDPETGEQLLIDSNHDGFRAGIERLAAERAEAFTKLARSAGADALDVRTGGDHAAELVRFFRMREKRK